MTGTERREDHELMAAMASGDTGALQALYDRHASLLFALCLRILRDRADAEEVLGDTFHELWRRAERYDPDRGAALPYMIGVARSRAIDRLRAGRRHRAVSADDPETTPGGALPADAAEGPHALAERGQTAARVRGALRSLRPAERRALEMAYFDGMSHSEVAGALGEPLGTIKTRIRQGLLRLRQALEPGEDRGMAS